MSLRYSNALLALCVVITALVVAAPVTAQSTNGRWVMPRTANGHPDLQGNWSNATLTPIQRPRDQSLVVSLEAGVARAQEQADYVARRAAPSDPNRSAPPVGGDGNNRPGAGAVGGYNDFYIDRGSEFAIYNGEIRSSLIVDPVDGRYPARTEASNARRSEARRLRGAAGIGQYDNPENRPLAERCLKSFGSNMGPPMLPNYFYNNNYTIVQTADHVMIMTEMVHDTRVIRLGEPKPLPANLQPWFGDSWGHWQGDTLVVETTNFHPTQRRGGIISGTSEKLKVTERFTRADENTLNYEFT
ncbi:MAG TPA: hypothetical protein DCF71_14755, partial [Gemmatimonadetes bacterium]|nr:hypothetical protein [Gemmatimonadota bacterium]